MEWRRGAARFFHAEQWAHHGHSEKELGQIPQYDARFYFATDDDADLFRWKWMNL